MAAIPEYFGSLVFDDRVMKARLSNNVYQSLNQTIREGNRLDPTLADAVADAGIEDIRWQYAAGLYWRACLDVDNHHLWLLISLFHHPLRFLCPD